MRLEPLEWLNDSVNYELSVNNYECKNLRLTEGIFTAYLFAKQFLLNKEVAENPLKE
jgi:hypothetical protein